jgi:hypothetical protein
MAYIYYYHMATVGGMQAWEAAGMRADISRQAVERRDRKDGGNNSSNDDGDGGIIGFIICLPCYLLICLWNMFCGK